MAPTLRPLGLLVLLGSVAARAQPATWPVGDVAALAPDTTAHRYGTSVALALLLTEDGLGAGASARTRLTDDLSFAFETSVGAARDEREQQFFVGFFGETVTPFKRNYAAVFPLHVGLERRLFRRQVEDNVRPFVSLTAGPTFALQWPYFDDANRNGIREADEERLGLTRGLRDPRFRLGVGGTFAVGVAVGSTARAAQSLRFGFTGHVFPARIDLLELDPAVETPSRRTFWTPTVSFHVVRLLR